MTIYCCIDSQPPRPVESSTFPPKGSHLRVNQGIDEGLYEVLEVYVIGNRIQIQVTRV